MSFDTNVTYGDYANTVKSACVSAEKKEAFEAGYDCGRNGATTENCHFRFFGNTTLKEAWERGNKQGESESR